MKKALTGARIFSGKNFVDNKALLFENENIIQLVDETEILLKRYQREAPST